MKEPKFTKKITIQMTDRVFGELHTSLALKKMSGGFYGAADEFMFKFLNAIKSGEENIDFSFKEERGE